MKNPQSSSIHISSPSFQSHLERHSHCLCAVCVDLEALQPKFHRHGITWNNMQNAWGNPIPSSSPNTLISKVHMLRADVGNGRPWTTSRPFGFTSKQQGRNQTVKKKLRKLWEVGTTGRCQKSAWDEVGTSFNNFSEGSISSNSDHKIPQSHCAALLHFMLLLRWLRYIAARLT